MTLLSMGSDKIMIGRWNTKFIVKSMNVKTKSKKFFVSISLVFNNLLTITSNTRSIYLISWCNDKSLIKLGVGKLWSAEEYGLWPAYTE